MIEFSEQQKDNQWGVAFGHGSWVYIDYLGMIDHAASAFDRDDRGFKATSMAALNQGIRMARHSIDGPYGKPDSAKRRKLCGLIAKFATLSTEESNR